MSKKSEKYNYKKAEADLDAMGVHAPDEIYNYRSEKGFRSYMKENGLNPDKYTKADSKNKNSGSNNAGCYLTTACVEAKHLPDDCTELQTLRAFRDSYMAALPNGEEEVAQYYQMAPGIVAAINEKENHQEIWTQVYSELVAPSVVLIQAQQNEEAYQLYKAYALALGEKYLN